MWLIELFANGPVQSTDMTLLVLRLGVGVAFAISGANKLFNRQIHASLRRNLEMNKIPYLSFCEWWVPFWEFASGVMLTLGFLTGFNAVVLAIICVVAIGCSSKRKVAKKNPINASEAATEYLFLFDILLLWMLVALMFAGGGAFSVDHLILK